MFIAHLPAGYLATRGVLRRAWPPEGARRRLMLLGLAASVLPDLDLLWFYLVDQRRQGCGGAPLSRGHGLTGTGAGVYPWGRQRPSTRATRSMR